MASPLKVYNSGSAVQVMTDAEIDSMIVPLVLQEFASNQVYSVRGNCTAYANNDGNILNIEDMIPHSEQGIRSQGPASFALEMNKGWFDKNNGNPLGHIDLTGIGAKRLKGLAFDGEDNLYISDVLANAIYKVETGNAHKVSVLSVVARATGRIWGV